MIRNATLTILGLWQYDHTVLDGLQVPQGISKETLSDNLLMECAELEAIYPDPDFMKKAVTSWSAMMIPVWNELYATTQYEYNPIWNKDGTITETVTRGLETKGRTTRDRDLADTTTRDLGTTDNTTRDLDTTENTTRDLDTTDNGTITGTSEEINQTKGFNSTTWADSTKKSGTTSSTTAASGSEDETVEKTGSEEETISKTGSEEETISKTGSDDETVNQTGAEDETTTLSRVEQGNIGVTTTQRMIQEQREVVEFNIIRRIIDDFKMRFCILVY